MGFLVHPNVCFTVLYTWNGMHYYLVFDERMLWDLNKCNLLPFSLQCLNFRNCCFIPPEALTCFTFNAQGFRRVFNVSGGIHQYALKADQSVPTYWIEFFIFLNEILLLFFLLVSHLLLASMVHRETKVNNLLNFLLWIKLLGEFLAYFCKHLHLLFKV